MLQEPHQMIQIIIFQWWLLTIVNDELQGTQCNFSIWDFEPWDSVTQSGVSLSGWLFNYWNVGKFCIEKFITYVLWMWKLVCHSNKRTYIKGWLVTVWCMKLRLEFLHIWCQVIQLISDNFLEILYLVLCHRCLHVLLLLLPSAEEALKVLKELEDQQDMHNPTLKYTEPARMVMDNIFETIKSFCGPSYK